MSVHFECTQCGKCCRDLKLPLTAAEAVQWLGSGHQVQIICDALPWVEELPPDHPDGQRAAHRKRRSFGVMSGTVPTRVVVILAANLAGACPNLMADMRCAIYERRPLVCRIYPAEINPFVVLEPEKKACPPEAWDARHPLLQAGGRVMGDELRRDILQSRDMDARDAGIKLKVCSALNLTHAAVAQEGFVVHSPSPASLLDALASAIAGNEGPPLRNQWRFVSNRSETIDSLAKSGAIAVHSRSLEAGQQYLAFKPDSPSLPLIENRASASEA